MMQEEEKYIEEKQQVTGIKRNNNDTRTKQ